MNLNDVRQQTINLGLKLLYPFLYFGTWNKDKILFKIDESTVFEVRVGTADKFVILESWNQLYDGDNFAINPDDIVVDIGAHIGAFSVYAARKATKGKIYSYEPHKTNYEQLLKNKSLNNCENIYTYNFAVSGKKGFCTLFISKTNTGGNSIYKLVDANAELKVPAVTIADIFNDNKLKRIDFLKIDVEGAEYDIVLKTPPKILKKIDKISMEFHDYLSHGHDVSEIRDYLEKNGFAVKIYSSMVQRFLKVGVLKASRLKRTNGNQFY